MAALALDGWTISAAALSGLAESRLAVSAACVDHASPAAPPASLAHGSGRDRGI